VLKRAEEAGLVHVVSNTGKYLNFICNCCACHCENLKSLKRSADAGLAALSSFISAIDAGQCTGCGDCISRCPMEALAMKWRASKANVVLAAACASAPALQGPSCCNPGQTRLFLTLMQGGSMKPLFLR
jgi:Pyruvate/2-oxoacid:ferredoxin oxidoreductase delta subunit